MVKPLIFAASLLSGTGLFAYAVKVQHHTGVPDVASLQPSPDAVRVVPPARTATISEPEPVVVEPATVDIEPVVIRAPAKYHAPPAAPEPEVPPPTTTPCSSWRELGPQFVSSSAQTGTHQVRELCD
jgi:hypothetical protein